VGWTALAHVAVGLAVFAAARALTLPWPGLLGTIAGVILAAPFRDRLLALMPDRRRPAWRVHLLEIPYFAHWCAATFAMLVMIGAAVVWPVLWAVKGTTPFDLPVVVGWGYLAGVLISIWGVWIRRTWVITRRIEVTIRGLPRSWDGFRIVQLSDLHIGSFSSRRTGLDWARRANALRPDIIAVTGDLLTSGEAFFSDVADVIGALKAPHGVFVSPGNHDYFGGPGELFEALTGRGAQVLRNRSVRLERDGTALVVAGVDDTWTRRADLDKALEGRDGASATVLLAHDPDLFPHAARASVDLVLSGHTHGGQVAVPFLARWINLSSFAHLYHLGLYDLDGSKLYVNAGLGVTGPPVRIGAAPEIAVLTLRAALDPERS